MTAEVPIVALAATKGNHPGGAANATLACRADWLLLIVLQVVDRDCTKLRF